MTCAALSALVLIVAAIGAVIGFRAGIIAAPSGESVAYRLCWGCACAVVGLCFAATIPVAVWAEDAAMTCRSE